VSRISRAVGFIAGDEARLGLDAAAAQLLAHAAVLQVLPADFNQINAVLAGLVDAVQERLNGVSPLYRFVDDVGGDVDRTVVNFSIARARQESWRLATALASMDQPAQERRIAEQDRAVCRLGRHLLRPGLIASVGMFGVRVTESWHPSAIIERLSDPALH
jgi:hypothetical protein